MSYVCERCGKNFDEDWRKDKEHIRKNLIPRFCSRACANSRIRTEEVKMKISTSMKTSEKEKEAARRRSISFLGRRKVPYEKRICPVCGKTFEVSITSLKKYCDRVCYSKTVFPPPNNLRFGKSGYYKGAKYDSTYELCWAIYNLDHNIPFKRSKVQIPYMYQGKQHTYYPDFELEDGTLIEIKGRHTSLVDIKTQAAISQGYNIKILYGKDLKDIFSYIEKTYKTKQFYSLYDECKKKFTYQCSCCGKEVVRPSEAKTLVFCNRKCVGKYYADLRYKNLGRVV